MTDNDTTLDPIVSESTRRTFLKAGAVASGSVALGFSGFGSVAAQDDAGGVGVMLNSQFSGGARFTVASDSLGWAPIESEFDGTQYDTRVINYDWSSGAYAMLFVPQEAGLQEGEAYEFSTGIEAVDVDEGVLDGDLLFDDAGEVGLVGVEFSPIQSDATANGNQTTGDETTGTETTALETATTEPTE
ncbi:hypothetical protein [Halorussus marinus]|uniref:hypothetical protein n=1 Tax=Halorussus marinus TaxID=2505976 RepID=UPI00106ECF37|nr:hypothetical protein [Halorussus marinus]